MLHMLCLVLSVRFSVACRIEPIFPLFVHKNNLIKTDVDQICAEVVESDLGFESGFPD